MPTTHIKKFSKILFLRLCKCLFMFSLAKMFTKDKLRIICLHGFSTGDECLWASGIMMHPETLESRLKYLTNNGYTILPLSDAVSKLRDNKLSPHSVVITIDDGFKSTYSLAHPLFKKYKCPYTIYQTTYYCDKDLPLVNLVLQYSLWKTKLGYINFSFIDDNSLFNINNTQEKARLLSSLITYVDSISSLESRKDCLRTILNLLEVNAEYLLSSDCFQLISTLQAQKLRADGVEIQLHTHRHRFPPNREEAEAELAANKAWIVSAIGEEPVHFCYPSNQYHLPLLDFLRQLGIQSATTCYAGLNDINTDPLLLRRFLDGNKIHPLEFEAHLTGFIFLFRKLFQLGPDSGK